MAAQKPCECKPVVVVWIGYHRLDFSGPALTRQQRKLLRDIVCRPVKFMKFTSDDINETNFLNRTRRILDFNGTTVGYGVVLSEPATEINFSDVPYFTEAWMDELGRPLMEAFDVTVRPCVFVTVGKAAQ